MFDHNKYVRIRSILIVLVLGIIFLTYVFWDKEESFLPRKAGVENKITDISSVEEELAVESEDYEDWFFIHINLLGTAFEEFKNDVADSNISQIEESSNKLIYLCNKGLEKSPPNEPKLVAIDSAYKSSLSEYKELAQSVLNSYQEYNEYNDTEMFANQSNRASNGITIAYNDMLIYQKDPTATLQTE